VDVWLGQPLLTPVAQALTTADFDKTTRLGSLAIDGTVVGARFRPAWAAAKVNAPAVAMGSECHVPKMTRHQIRDDVIATGTAPAQQVFGGDQNTTIGSIAAARATGAAVQLFGCDYVWHYLARAATPLCRRQVTE